MVELIRVQNGLETLTARERDVLALLAAGHTNAGIERALFLSAKTIEAHITSIYLKLSLGGRGDLHRRVVAAWAYRDAMRPAA